MTISRLSPARPVRAIPDRAGRLPDDREGLVAEAPRLTLRTIVGRTALDRRGAPELDAWRETWAVGA